MINFPMQKHAATKNQIHEALLNLGNKNSLTDLGQIKISHCGTDCDNDKDRNNVNSEVVPASLAHIPQQELTCTCLSSPYSPEWE